MKKALAAQEKEEELSEDDLSFDELDLDDDAEDTVDTVATQSEPQPEALEEASKSEQKPNEELEVKLEAETEQKNRKNPMNMNMLIQVNWFLGNIHRLKLMKHSTTLLPLDWKEKYMREQRECFYLN